MLRKAISGGLLNFGQDFLPSFVLQPPVCFNETKFLMLWQK